MWTSEPIDVAAMRAHIATLEAQLAAADKLATGAANMPAKTMEAGMGDLTDAQVSSRDMIALRRYTTGGSIRGEVGKRLQKAGMVDYNESGFRSITPAGIAALARHKEEK